MLARSDALAVGALLATLQGSNLPIRRPTYTRPAFWSRPLFSTKMRPVAGSSDWSEFLVVTGLNGYIAVVSNFVATSVGDIAVSGLLFRLRLNGNPLPLNAVNLTAGVEFNKTGPNTYPVVPRKLYQPVLETQRLAIEVKNTSAIQRQAVAAFYGWYYEAIDSTVFGHNGDSTTDATYPGQTGVGYDA